MWFINTRRIRELFDEEKVRMAAEAILSYRCKEVLLVLLYGWCILLGMVFSLLVTVRLALTLPLL